MLVAKRLGGNRIIDHASVLGEISDLHRQRAWHATITELLAAHHFSLAFQEIARLDGTESPPVFEALLRVEDADFDIGELIGAAVGTGLDVEIDRWVLHRVLDVLQVHADVVIAQNWSPRSFEQLGLVEDLAAELELRRVDPSRLIIEITEHASIAEPERFAVTVATLRELGVRVALDDLGAGWTSFRLLEAVEIDIIKLDGAWVRQVHTNPIAREMIATTVRCAKLFDLTVIAEWIEDRNDLHALQTLGVEWGQGYHFGKPRPLPDILSAASTKGVGDVGPKHRSDPLFG